MLVAQSYPLLCGVGGGEITLLAYTQITGFGKAASLTSAASSFISSGARILRLLPVRPLHIVNKVACAGGHHRCHGPNLIRELTSAISAPRPPKKPSIPKKLAAWLLMMILSDTFEKPL